MTARTRRASLARGAAAALCLGVLWGVMAAPSPSPTEPPVFQLYRTGAAARLHPGSVSPVFALLIGSDVRDGEPGPGRADSLHIVSLNLATMRGAIIGIPRDAYVPIPGVRKAKITEALYHGGPELVVRAVQDATGITLHYWAIIDFSRFRQLVDRLGGLDFEIPMRMADRDSGAYFERGPRKMNGAEALAFARNRHDLVDGDLGRSLNQGRLLVAALSKFRAEASDPFALLGYLDAFRTLVDSNVPVRDLLVLGSIARRLDPANVRNVVAPARIGWAGTASVVFLEAEARAMFDAVRDDGEL